ncbi:hypothetical protein VHUM_01500 [Vanrija humicola]|uniref:ENTH domain-containing protein n=1 Tax=Vanrija humicola TaxID=5417 RepID=A0A7D8V390_VANHU|nr:hypothetical protein VHUM_01500 [Vanrija humicola]
MAQSLQHLSPTALRVAKNYTKGYTDTQTKVRDATSNDPWGPSGTQMNEIAQLTYNQSDFVEIMEMLDKRLNDKGKNWRHVFKALTVLDYCLHAGSENVVIYFKDNLYIIKTLKEFIYVDDQGKDVGHNVRQKAKDITNLLQDEERLRSERRSRGAMRDRMLGNLAESGLRGEDDFGGPRHRRYSNEDRPPPSRPQPTRSRTTGGDDDELQRALQASIDSNNDEQRRRNQNQQEEDDLQKALRMSEEEEARKKREQEEATKNALFDDSLNLESNNQYQQQQQPVDLFAQQTTGFQLVDVNNPWGQQPLQPQYTSYNPFHAQMLAQQQQQQEELLRQQQMLQQQQQQQEYLRQQQLLQQQQQQASLLPQQTGYGSNNPFAPKPPQSSLLDPQPGSSFSNNSFLPVPQSTTPQLSSPSFTSQQPLTPSSPAKAPAKPAWQAPVKADDGNHSDLANLIGRGREDGLDTFGNVGNLRVPTGSVFHQSNRVAVQQTGLQPQATGFGANNPFGRPTQQQQQGQNSDQPFFSV